MTSFKKILEIFTSYSYCCINAVIAVDYVHRLFRQRVGQKQSVFYYFFNVIFWGILSDIILLYLGHSVQDLAIISCLKCCYSSCNLAKTVQGGVLPHSTLQQQQQYRASRVRT